MSNVNITLKLVLHKLSEGWMILAFGGGQFRSLTIIFGLTNVALPGKDNWTIVQLALSATLRTAYRLHDCSLCRTSMSAGWGEL